MQLQDKIRYIDRGTVTVLLECGHWSSGFSDRSSHWDFPEEPFDCHCCKEKGVERLMDAELIRHFLV